MTKVINNPPDVPTALLETVLTRALRGMRYGSVEIVVHDAKVVQIERKEKFRLQDSTFETRLED